MDKRIQQGQHWGPSSTRKPMSEKYWQQPLKWNAAAEKAGKPARVFCASMADVFEGHEDTLQHLPRLFKLIEATPWLTWLLLTKRPENVESLFAYTGMWYDGIPSNVWIGTSVENQEQANKRIPHLLEVPAKVRFLSVEPLLGKVDLTKILAADQDDGEHGIVTFNCLEESYCYDADTDSEVGGSWTIDGPLHRKIDWVIVGGESGLKARPMHPEWVRKIRNQCADNEVPFFFKQWGEWGAFKFQDPNAGKSSGLCYFSPDYESASAGNRNPEVYGPTENMRKVGKKQSGRLLDGREWNDYPLCAVMNPLT
jgi:protein gp37